MTTSFDRLLALPGVTHAYAGGGSGTQLTDSVGTNHGVLQGGYTRGSDSNEGGTGINTLNGSTGTCELGALGLGDVFSFAIRFMRNALSGSGNYPELFSLDNGAEYGFRSSAETAPYVSDSMDLGLANVGPFSWNSQAIPTGAWHRAVVTKNGSVTHIYYDGTENTVSGGVGNQTYANGGSNAWIGSDYGTQGFAAITFDQVVFANQAWTPLQVATIDATGDSPTAAISGISSQTTSGFTINAVVNPAGHACTVALQMGADTTYQTPAGITLPPPQAVASGSANVNLAFVVSGLPANAVEHCRIAVTPTS